MREWYIALFQAATKDTIRADCARLMLFKERRGKDFAHFEIASLMDSIRARNVAFQDVRKRLPPKVYVRAIVVKSATASNFVLSKFANREAPGQSIERDMS